MKKALRWLCLSLVLILLVACGKKEEVLPVIKSPLTRSESLLHTVVQLSIYHEGQEEVMDRAVAYIKEMEGLLSTNLEGSDVYRINQAAGKEPVVVDELSLIHI